MARPSSQSSSMEGWRSAAISRVYLDLAPEALIVCTQLDLLASRRHESRPRGVRVFIEPPRRRQWAIQVEEVAKTGLVTPAYRLLGHTVTAGLDSAPNAFQGHLVAWEPQERQTELVTGRNETPYPGCEAAARQRGLESEVLSRASQGLEPLHHRAAGLHGDAVRVKRRQAAGNEVGVHELLDAQDPPEEPRRGRGLPGAVGSCKSYDDGLAHGSGHQVELHRALDLPGDLRAVSVAIGALGSDLEPVRPRRKRLALRIIEVGGPEPVPAVPLETALVNSGDEVGPGVTSPAAAGVAEAVALSVPGDHLERGEPARVGPIAPTGIQRP